MNREPHETTIVIVGAGFAGIWAARTLASAKARVLVIDTNNYHTFLPLLYQVATAELKAEEIAYPVRGILRDIANAHFVMGTVLELDPAARTLKTECLTIPYDYLLIASGSSTAFFGIPGAAEYAFPLKTLEQGITVRNHILSTFERAASERDPALKKRALTFTVVGGGPTGVEFAGALAELIHGPLRKDYPEIRTEDIAVVLLEGGDHLLPGLPERMGDYARKTLSAKGVTVCLKTQVTSVRSNAVLLGDGSILPTDTVVWSAGIQGADGPRRWGLPTVRSERVEVLPTLQVAGHPEIFIAGDLALFRQDGQPLPVIAPVAVQQGRSAAQNIMLLMEDSTPQPFRYKDRGAMVTIGRNAAAAYLGGRVFTGFPAWLLWLVVHLLNLIGFPNRFFVFAQWAMDYFFFERTVRLIVPRKNTTCATHPHTD